MFMQPDDRQPKSGNNLHFYQLTSTTQYMPTVEYYYEIKISNYMC